MTHSHLKGFALIIALALVTGCAPMLFQKDGASATDLERDNYQCQVQEQGNPYAHAYARDPIGNMGYPFMARQNISRCMEMKGWKRADG